MRKALAFLATVMMGLVLSGGAFADERPLLIETAPHFINTEEFGRVLVGKDDNALYTFKKDHMLGAYPPKCTMEQDELPLGSCLKRWPAAVTSYEQFSELRNANPDLPYGVIYNKEVDSLQLTYEDLPMYYWFGDDATDQTNFTGLGVNGAWDLKSLDKVVTYDGKVKSR